SIGAQTVCAMTAPSGGSVQGQGVKVAVVDSGIDYLHPDLGGCIGPGCKVIGGYNFLNPGAPPLDVFGHGTHVAGIIAANGMINGVAPGASLLAYVVCNSQGQCQTSDIISGIHQAVTDGAQVINMSLGGPGDANDPLSQATDNAFAAGVIVAVAAGNAGPRMDTIGSPGAAVDAITVGAFDHTTNTMANFS